MAAQANGEVHTSSTTAAATKKKVKSLPAGMDKEAQELAAFMSVPSVSKAWLNASGSSGSQLTVCTTHLGAPAAVQMHSCSHALSAGGLRTA